MSAKAEIAEDELLCGSRTSASAEASWRLTREITEGPPSKKASKKRPLGTQENPFYDSYFFARAALGIAGPCASLLFLLLLFFLSLLSFFPSFFPPYSSSLLYFLDVDFRCCVFEGRSRATSSRNPLRDRCSLDTSAEIRRAYHVDESSAASEIDTCITRKQGREDHVIKRFFRSA